MDRRDLFTTLDLVFFDTTSIYFEGEGGATLGEKGDSRDHRSDLNQMVVGAVLDNGGNPLCCEMWPGNIADVKALIPSWIESGSAFRLVVLCGSGSRHDQFRGLGGAGAKRDSLYPWSPDAPGERDSGKSPLRGGRFREVRPEGESTQDPSPLKVKEVWIQDRRYIICLNVREARKDEQDRQTIIEALKEQLKRDPKGLIGNRGYRKYLKIDRDHIVIDQKKIEGDARFDGKWVLRTNMDLATETVALKYKELWQVEQVFRDMKSILETRPIYHQMDETIRGHVFCSFLALVLRKELDRRLDQAGHSFEWADIKQDLKSLQEITIEEKGKRLAIRNECWGVSARSFNL